MGSKRVGCPLPTPQDSRALRLGTLTNLFDGDLSFFFFCCVKDNTRENTLLLHRNQQENRKQQETEIWHGKFLESLCQIIMLKLTSVTQRVVWGPSKVFIYMESSKIDMLPGQKAQGKGSVRSGSPLFPHHSVDQGKRRIGWSAGCREQVREEKFQIPQG